MMILHHGWRSSASRRVRLCLEEKGLSYEGHIVDMAKMEHHSPEYLKINPLGVIPTLIHDGRPLHESGTICEYLDETFPDPPLRPATPYERAEMRNWIRHIDALIGNLIIFNWRHHLQKVASAMVGRGTRREDEEHPEQGAPGSLAARGAQALHRRRTRRRPRKASAVARQDGRGAQAFRLAGRPSLFHRRHRRRAVCEAHRRGDRAGRDADSIPASANGGQRSRRDRPLRAPISAHSSLPESSTRTKDLDPCWTSPRQAKNPTPTARSCKRVEDGVGVITFNNPEKRNAMSLEMWEGLGQALTELRDDPAVRVVILVGAGDKAFVSGADISQFEKTRHNAEASEEYSRRSEAQRALLGELSRSRPSPASAAFASAAACRSRC